VHRKGVEKPVSKARGLDGIFWMTAIGVLGMAASCRKPETPASARRAGAQRLARTEALELHPSFSPRGDELVYSTSRSGRFEIAVRRSDGQGQERFLTSDGRQNFQPAWSPDGLSIVYHSKVRGGLWIVPAAGGEPRRLTDFGSSPAWSPSGDEVVFQSHALYDLGATAAVAIPPCTIWKVSAKGGIAHSLTKEGAPFGGHGAPVFGEGGKRVFFVVTDQRVSYAQLWSVPAAGGSPEEVLKARRLYELAVFGRELVYGGVQTGSQFGVYRLRLSPDGKPAGEPETLALLGESVPRGMAFSRDGKRLGWSALRSAGSLWVLPLSGTGQPAGALKPFVSDGNRNTWPVFSPDGSRVAFGKTIPGANGDVWMMSADGTGATQLTTDRAIDFLQDWFPDGRRILIMSDRSGRFEPWILDVEDRSAQALRVAVQDLWAPRLSPDGTRLVYNSKAGGVTVNVWQTELAGRKTSQLTFDRESLAFPCWSPDGKWLALQVRRGDDTHLAVMPSAGGDPELLTSGPGQSWASSWAPDSERIAFAGLRDDVWNIYAVSRVSRQVTQLTSFSRLDAYVRYPAWSPRNDQIVFEYAETIGDLFTLELPR